MRFNYAAVMLLAFVSSVHAESFSYKGLALGASAEELRERLPNYMEATYTGSLYNFKSIDCARKNPGNSEAVQQCLKATSFGGVPVETGSIYLRVNQIYSIDLKVKPWYVGELIGAITARYGKHSDRKTLEYRNEYGVKSEGWIYTWVSGSTSLTVEDNGGKELAVRIGSFQSKQEILESMRKAAEIGAKDF